MTTPSWIVQPKTLGNMYGKQGRVFNDPRTAVDSGPVNTFIGRADPGVRATGKLVDARDDYSAGTDMGMGQGNVASIAKVTPQGTATISGNSRQPWIVSSARPTPKLATAGNQPRGVTNPDTNSSYIVKPAAAAAPKTNAFDPSRQGKLQDIWNYTQDTNANFGNASAPTEEYKPYVNFLENTQSGEDGMTRSQTWNELNWDALPNKGMTPFGKIGTQAISVKNINGLADKSKVYFDPNYGWVTPKNNVQQSHNLIHKIGSNGALMASLAMGGILGAGLPVGAITSGLKTAMGGFKGAMNGSFDPVSLGLSALGASGSVPDWVVPAAKTGVSLSKIYGGR